MYKAISDFWVEKFYIIYQAEKFTSFYQVIHWRAETHFFLGAVLAVTDLPDTSTDTLLINLC